jgi:hypothetical protein
VTNDHGRFVGPIGERSNCTGMRPLQAVLQILEMLLRPLVIAAAVGILYKKNTGPAYCLVAASSSARKGTPDDFPVAVRPCVLAILPLRIEF